MQSNQEQNTPEKATPKGNISAKYYYYVIALFTLLGVIGGYVYYLRVGCSSGGCMITSNPYLTVIWGGVMGYLLADLFFKPRQDTA